MRMNPRSFALLGLVTLLSTSAFGADRPNFDAFGARPPMASRDAGLVKRAEAAVNPGVRIQTESRLGVPTFLWVQGSNGAAVAATQSRTSLGLGVPAESAARAILTQFASLYGLSAADVSAAVVTMVHDTGAGAVIVKFHQQVGGIDIFHEEINVLMNRNLEAVAISGYVSSVTTAAAEGGSLAFVLAPPAAAASAVRDLTNVAVSGANLASVGFEGGYEKLALTGATNAVLDENVRVKQVYYHLPEGLEAAYYVEVIGRSPESVPGVLDGTGQNSGSSEGYGYVISAVNGAILFRKNLSADAVTYRVWADPITKIPYDVPAGNGADPKVVPAPDGAQAPFVATQDVSLLNFPFSQNDPWLAPGATETNGNNVDAYLNLFSPDGFGNPTTTSPADPANGDFRAQATATDQFLHQHTPDTNTWLAEGRQGSIQQLFYNVNFLHDWYYDSGFNEAAGNAQKNNFGRGGLGNDDIKAQSQDFSGFSNANMLTPADGARPRMRMYVFPNLANKLDIQAPAAIAAAYQIGVSMSGPGGYDITNDLVIATFSNSPSACTITNAPALAGKIAMFDFDNTDSTGCSFSTRISRITLTTTATSMVMVYTSGNPAVVANITGFVVANTKPVATMSWNTGQLIKGQMAIPATVTARLFRLADRDGTIDNQIVFHEWCHYMSNRLVGNGSGLGANMSAGMGEGWSDFNAMILTARQDDASVPSNANWNGVYALATYATSGIPFNGSANQGYYFGIRRYPYSTDMTKNPLTFKHIQNGIALPVGPPVAFGADGSNNAEVHNTGEVWTTMLWECYAALLRDTQGATPRLTFQQAQDRMKLYLVASLKMTPIFPNFTEARDAVLAAAYATDVIDFVEFQQAFAKRGIGTGAVSPDRFASNNATVTESFASGPGLVYVSSVLDDGVASCDADGVLDSGETGHLTVTLKNIGTTTLKDTTATVTSTTPGISFPNGNTIAFPASDPLTSTTGSVVVAYAPGFSGIQELDFQIAYNDTQLGGAPLTVNPGFRGNTNDIPAASATDSVEAHGTQWTVSSSATLGVVAPWQIQEVNPLQHVWHATDPNAGSDEYLTSPVFTVDGSGSLNVQFDHSWGFEFDGGGNYDGGVIEASVNGGAWADVGASAYNGTILNYSGDVNPLAGRSAFVANSAGTVHTSLTSAIAPGSTVQVRFRFGSDSTGAAAGWDVDNIAFTGVVETPFAILVADPGCSLPTTTTLSASANPSPFGANLTLTATVSSANGPVGAGTVTFYDGATPLGGSPVSSGIATYATSSLSQGLHSLTARFGGAIGLSTSTSNAINESITKPVGSVALASSQNPSAIGQSVTFTATVTGVSGTPTGSVAFTDGATPLGTIALSGGVATVTTSSLSGGTHTITAAYSGNGTYASSSTSIAQVVSLPVITPGGPTTFCAGGSVTLTSSSASGNQWSLNGNPIGGATNQSYVATASGSYTVTVTVGAASGTSLPVVVTVNALPLLPVITAPATAAPGAAGLVASVVSDAGSTYAWTISNGTITAGNGTNQITFTAGVSGPLGLTVVEMNASSCASAQASATVNVLAISFALHTLSPCRLLDTRTATGPSAGAPKLAAGETRTVAVGGRCAVPSSAKALAVNVTASGQTSAGFVVAYPADISPAIPVGVSIFFKANQTRANNGLLVLANDGSGFKIQNVSNGTIDFILDVTGWFE